MEFTQDASPNGHSEVLATLAEPEQVNAYPVDAPETRVSVASEHGKARVVVTHVFSPLKLDHLTRYAQEVVNETEMSGKGRQSSRINTEVAETNLFNSLTLGASAAVTHAGKTQEHAITREQALDLTLEEKTKALDRLRDCAVRVETTVEESGIDFLFERDGEMEVALLVGDEDTPAYTVPMKFKRPSGARRQQLRDGFVRPERKRKKGKLVTKLVTDFRKAAEFFDQHFISAGNVLVEGGPYSDEKKAVFLRTFSPWFKAEIASALVESFEQSEDF